MLARPLPDLGSRRQAVLGIGALALAGVTAARLWRDRDALPQTTPIPSAPGFRRLPTAGSISGGAALSIGLDAAADAAPPPFLEPAALCRALFRAPGPGVPVAVFSDYFCPVCPQVGPRLAGIRVPALSVTYHEWPVLGPRSDFAARIGLAAARFGPADAVHDTLMALRPRPSLEGARAAAGALGLEPEALAEEVTRPDIDAELAQVARLAFQLGLQGTPALVVGRVVISGLPSAAVLRRLARAEAERAGAACPR